MYPVMPLELNHLAVESILVLMAAISATLGMILNLR